MSDRKINIVMSIITVAIVIGVILGLFWNKKPTCQDVIHSILNNDVSLYDSRYANCRNDFGMRPLHAAIGSGNIELVKRIISDGENVDAITIGNELSSLHIAAGNKNPRFISLIVNVTKDIDGVNFNGNTPLMIAILTKNFDNARILINKNANVNIANKDGLTPLILALIDGHRETVNLLLHKNADKFHKDKLGMNAYDYGVSDYLK